MKAGHRLDRAGWLAGWRVVRLAALDMSVPTAMPTDAAAARAACQWPAGAGAETEVGFTKDLWTSKVAQPDGTVKRMRNARWGKGKRWLAVWHDPSGRECSKTFPVKESADKCWSAMETDVARGGYVDPKAGNEKIGDVGRRWLRSRVVDPRSIVIYETSWRLHVEPVFGNRPVGSVRPSEIQAWLADLGEKHLNSTLVTAYIVLRGLLELAVADGQLKDNPARSRVVTKPSSRSTEKVRIWPDAVVGSIIDVHPEELRLLPVLEVGCGIRVSEGLGMSEADFDFEEHMLHVRRQVKRVRTQHIFGLPKNDRERAVPMPTWVEAMARQHFRQFPASPVTLPWEKVTGQLVTVQLAFTRADGSFIRYRDYSQHVWKPGLVRAGIIPAPTGTSRSLKYATTRREGPHQLRHFYASVMLNDGASITELAEYPGHQDPAVTLRIYGHLQPNSHEKARKIIDARLFRPRAVAGEAGRPE
jgi:integrase